MSLTIGYLIPGSPRGGVFTLPDGCREFVTDADANDIAAALRSVGYEPSWQAVRGAALELARSRRTEKQSKESLNDKQPITDLGREGIRTRIATGTLYVSPGNPRTKGQAEMAHRRLAKTFAELPGIPKLIAGINNEDTQMIARTIESSEVRHDT